MGRLNKAALDNVAAAALIAVLLSRSSAQEVINSEKASRDHCRLERRMDKFVIADHSASGRVVSVLEGGYDLQGLKESVAAHVTTLMGG